MVMRVTIFMVTMTALMVHRLAMQDDIVFLPSYSLVLLVVMAFEANLYHKMKALASLFLKVKIVE